MKRLIIAILLTSSLVAFSMANGHHVELSVVFGAPIKIRLIFLLLVTFFVGAAVPYFLQLTSAVRRRQQFRRSQRMHETGEVDLVRD